MCELWGESVCESVCECVCVCVRERGVVVKGCVRLCMWMGVSVRVWGVDVGVGMGG